MKVNQLPNVSLQHIFMMAGTLPVLSRVCKKWRTIGQNERTVYPCYEVLFKAYERNRTLEVYTKRALFYYPIPNKADAAFLRIQTVVSLVLSDAGDMLDCNKDRRRISKDKRFISDPLHPLRIAAIAELAEESICKSLVKFFSSLAAQLPEAQDANKTLKGTAVEKAPHIRGWLESNQRLLAKLQLLRLSYCSLTFLPSEIRFFPNLRSLFLEHNQISTLPIEIGSLRQLCLLDMSENQLCALPAAIKHLTKLKYLFLSQNQLIELPEEISRLTKLKALHLRDNCFEEFPQSICSFASLLELDLSLNEIQKVNGAINQMRSLARLFLHGNCLRHLPPELCQLKELETLDIRFNRERLLVPKELLLSDNPAIQSALVKAELSDRIPDREPPSCFTSFQKVTSWLF